MSQQSPSTPAKVVFREATLADQAGLNELFREELAYHSEIMPEMFSVPDTVVSEAWLRGILVSESEFMVMAEEDEELLGVIWYRLVESPEDSILKTRHFAYIQELMVTESSRRQGLGRMLVEYAFQNLEARGIKNVELNIWEKNARALEFYRSLGFTTIQQRLSLSLD